MELEQAPPEPPALRSGWLRVFHPPSGAWRPRWCVLSAAGPGVAAELALFADERGALRTGCIQITPDTRVVRYADTAVSGGAVPFRGERPFGFALDVDVAGGLRRQLFHFDAGSATAAEEWTGLAADGGAGLALVPGSPTAGGAACGCCRACRACGACMAPAPLEIDDLSDYEDNTMVRSSSFGSRHDLDWTTVGGSPADSASVERPMCDGSCPWAVALADASTGEGGSGSYDIDDLSDYEDDEHARKSSLCEVEHRDWTALGVCAAECRAESGAEGGTEALGAPPAVNAA
mmetsp:Transcript_107566/g.334428  ORF Transcript_107566/g.334428 Transcript_107566/m.334428 type:complete len:291 (+) Transcript_107566:53-925(+)